MTLTAEGLEIPSLEELLARRAAAQRASIDSLLANTGDSVLGNINAIEASHDREAYEVLQTLTNAINRDHAEGAMLDAVCAITGTPRNPARATRFAGTRPLLVNMNNGATVTAGVTKFAVTANPAIEFVATKTVTNAGATADIEIEAECTTLGAIQVGAGTVTTIATPTAGLNYVTHTEDAITGAEIETDAALRLRAERELRAPGASTVGGIASDLLAIEDADGNNPILSCVILENVEDYWVGSLPPHSFKAVIWDSAGADADDADVIAVIADNRPAGIKAVGDIGTAPNQFSRAVQADFEVEVTIRKSVSGYGGDDAVKAAVLARAVELGPRGDTDGSGVIAFSAFLDAVMHVPGVNRVTLVRLKFSSGAWVENTDLVPGLGEVGVTELASISVISSTGL